VSGSGISGGSDLMNESERGGGVKMDYTVSLFELFFCLLLRAKKDKNYET